MTSTLPDGDAFRERREIRRVVVAVAVVSRARQRFRDGEPAAAAIASAGAPVQTARRDPPSSPAAGKRRASLRLVIPAERVLLGGIRLVFRRARTLGSAASSARLSFAAAFASFLRRPDDGQFLLQFENLLRRLALERGQDRGVVGVGVAEVEARSAARSRDQDGTASSAARQSPPRLDGGGGGGGRRGRGKSSPRSKATRTPTRRGGTFRRGGGGTFRASERIRARSFGATHPATVRCLCSPTASFCLRRRPRRVAANASACRATVEDERRARLRRRPKVRHPASLQRRVASGVVHVDASRRAAETARERTREPAETSAEERNPVATVSPRRRTPFFAGRAHAADMARVSRATSSGPAAPTRRRRSAPGAPRPC